MADEKKPTEEDRSAYALELAQVNVLRVSELIAHAGQAIIEDAQGKKLTSQALLGNALLLANAVNVNEKNRLTAFPKRIGGGTSAANRVGTVVFQRKPLPSQLATAEAGAPAAPPPPAPPAPPTPPPPSEERVHTPEVITEPKAPPPRETITQETLTEMAFEAAAENADNRWSSAILRALHKARQYDQHGRKDRA